MAEVTKAEPTSASKPRKPAASPTSDPSDDQRTRAFVPKRKELAHGAAYDINKEVQYREKRNGPVMKVKIIKRERDKEDQWTYQVQDSDGKPVKGGGDEAIWIPEKKLIAGV